MASSSSSLDEKPAISSPIFSSLFLSNQINLFYNMAYNWYTKSVYLFAVMYWKVTLFHDGYEKYGW